METNNEKKREAAKLSEKTAKKFELTAKVRQIYYIPCHQFGTMKVEDITPEQAKELVEKGCTLLKSIEKTEKEPETAPASTGKK